MTSYALIRGHSFGDILREHSRSRPHKKAAAEANVSLSYKELNESVSRLANNLKAIDTRQSSRVLWIGKNSIHLYVLMLAAAKMGAVLCPVNWRQSREEIEFIIRDFDPHIVFWQRGTVDPSEIDSFVSTTKVVHWIEDVGGPTSLLSMYSQGSTRDDEDAISSDLPLIAIYTAAHDGRPSAALLSHTAILCQGVISAIGQSVDERTNYLVSGPMFHLGTLMGLFATYVFGGLCAFVEKIDPEHALRVIEQLQITHAFLPAPVVEAMRAINAQKHYDISSLFANADLSDWSSAIVMPKGAPLLGANVYGQTEISGISVMSWLGGVAAGRPTPFTQVKIVDEAGNEVPPGQVGEISVRGWLVMNGYHNRQEENARRSRDGWHRTYDLGKRLEDGSIQFVGPKVAMIKCGMENIYPTEVENCILLHPAVAKVCVIGVPDEKWDQLVKAVVVLKEGQAVTPSEIIEHSKAHISSYKKPAIVEVVTELPVTTDGHVDRDRVNDLYGGGGYPATA